MIARLERVEKANIDNFQFSFASAPNDAQSLETILAVLQHSAKQGEAAGLRITSASGIERERWDTLRQQGEEAQKAGDLANASEIWLKALAEAQEFNADDVRLVYTVDKLSTIHLVQRQFETAEPLLKLACELKRELGLEQELGAALGELGKCYFEKGEFPKAEPALLESIAIFERNFGSDHELVGEGVHNLATLYHLQDKTDEAGKAYQKAIQIKRNYLGRNHPDTIKIAQNYTKLLRRKSTENPIDIGYISGTWRTLNFDPSGEIASEQQVDFST
jgi:tetratricopeptide (TPR) repeat protein